MENCFKTNLFGNHVQAADAAPGKSTPELTPKGMDISSEKSARLGRLIGERKTPSSRAGKGVNV
jgi:hypothetical protein